MIHKLLLLGLLLSLTGMKTHTETVSSELVDSKLRPCMQSIFNDLKALPRGSVGQIMQKFSDPNSGYNWELKDDSLSGRTAITDPSSYQKATKTIRTTFDSQAWPRATDLSWARTMLHESVHAYLLIYFITNKTDFIRTYPHIMQHLNAKHNWDAAHHEEFSRSLVFSIAYSLEEYGKMKGYELPKQFYQDLSWAGLQETSAFQKLSLADQIRILDVISVELTGLDSKGNAQQQMGKNSNCALLIEVNKN